MGAKEVLEYFDRYRFEHPTFESAYRSDADRTLALIAEASYQNAEWVTADVVEFAVAHIDGGPRHIYTMLHNLERMDLFLQLFDRAPHDAVDALYYVCTNTPKLLNAGLIERMCRHATSNPYQAFHALQFVLVKRPELIQRPVVETVVNHLSAAPNQAFYFIRELLKVRAEFTPLCVLALFECVLAVEQPYLRHEMIQDIVTIADMSHLKTGLERELRETPDAGTKRARALMAILFRQKFRDRQHEIFEALYKAARLPPIWEFMLYLLDCSDVKVVSTHAAERFLEGTHRLSYLLGPNQFETYMLDKFEFKELPEIPPPLPFLTEDLELYRRASVLASRVGRTLTLAPIEEFSKREEAAERELAAVRKLVFEAQGNRRASLEARELSILRTLERWKKEGPDRREQHELTKKFRDALHAEMVRLSEAAIQSAQVDAFRESIQAVLGRELDPWKIDPNLLPAFLYYERLGPRMPKNQKYLARLIEDRIEGRPHDWLRTEPPAVAWAERVRAGRPEIRLERWRAPYSAKYQYHPTDAASEKKRRIKEELARTRELFAQLKIEGMESADFEKLRDKASELHRLGKDSGVVDEIEMNLERVRIAMNTPDSDFEGAIELSVETDPIQYLFMGEYGFSSCLSLRGSNVWSAVSNAIDIDKVIVWAKEPGGNIVGRRLIALTEHGVVSYATYTNRHGLSLDRFFEEFIAAYAAHCGTQPVRRIKVRPLLSDAWYDDGAL